MSPGLEWPLWLGLARQVSTAPADVEGVWYSGTTVYLVADNLPNAKRVQQVLAHEAVGHAALEDMLGKELMAQLIQNVQNLDKMGNKLVREVAARVDKTQPGLSPTQRAKEIVAVMAERGEHVKGKVWQQMVQAIRDFLRGLGFNIAFSERDILAMLRKAEAHVSEPAGAGGALAATASAHSQSGNTVPVVEINEHSITGVAHPITNKQLREIADAILRSLRQEIKAGTSPLVNTQTGWELSISSRDVGKMGNNPHMKPASSKAVTRARDLVAVSILAETHPDTQGHGAQSVHRFYAPAIIDGKLYRVRLTVLDYHETLGNRNLHAIRAVEIENAPLGTLQPADASKDAATAAQPTTGRTITIGQLLAGVKNEDGSPLNMSSYSTSDSGNDKVKLYVVMQHSNNADDAKRWGSSPTERQMSYSSEDIAPATYKTLGAAQKAADKINAAGKMTAGVYTAYLPSKWMQDRNTIAYHRSDIKAHLIGQFGKIGNNQDQDPSYSRSGQEQYGKLTPEQSAALMHVFGKPKTVIERAREFSQNWQMNLIQGIVDQYAPIKELTMAGYIKARMAKGVASTLEVTESAPPRLAEVSSPHQYQWPRKPQDTRRHQVVSHRSRISRRRIAGGPGRWRHQVESSQPLVEPR